MQISDAPIETVMIPGTKSYCTITLSIATRAIPVILLHAYLHAFRLAAYYLPVIELVTHSISKRVCCVFTPLSGVILLCKGVNIVRDTFRYCHYGAIRHQLSGNSQFGVMC